MINHKIIKTVIFDWGGVCCSAGEPFASPALQKKLALNPEQITAQVKKIHQDYYCGLLDRDGFWQKVLSHFHLTPNRQLNPRTLSTAYLRSYHLYSEVLAAARKLQARYRIGLLSNLTPEMRDHIRKAHHTARYFPTEIYSCDPDVRMMKPVRQIFVLAAKKLHSHPSHCLFIDDSSKNVTAARKLGMQTILFKNPEQFLKDIQPLL